MDQNIKTIVIALGAAVIGGGLVIAGMKVAAPATEKAAKTADSAQVENKDAAPDATADAASPKAKTPTAKAPTAGTATPKAVVPKAAAGASGSDAQLSAQFAASPWCSFSYNQYSGTSSTTRYVFSTNGTFSSGGRGETYSSGDAGTVSGQSDTSGGGQWKIQNQRLYISSADTGYQFLDVNAQLTQNSNGYPIITVNGTEYTQCN